MTTTIEWTERTWNPVTGCTKVSPGCAHCYAETFAKRFGRNGGSYLPGLAEIICHPERLSIPLRRKKPTMYFANSMSDLFHEDVPESFIDAVWIVMGLSPHHTFQILTKRPERMLEWATGSISTDRLARAFHLVDRACPGVRIPALASFISAGQWFARNAWLGVSVENQVFADERIPLLLETPAAVRFLSVEPLLKAVDLGNWVLDPALAKRVMSLSGFALLDWLIVGGESGPKARPMKEEWARSIVNDGRTANVPVFMKQMGSVWAKEHGLKGKAGNIDDFPKDLQVRQWPKLFAPTSA